MKAAPTRLIKQGQQLSSDRFHVLARFGTGRSRRELRAQPREVGRKPLVLGVKAGDLDRQPVVLGTNQRVLTCEPAILSREGCRLLLSQSGSGLGVVALLLAQL